RAVPPRRRTRHPPKLGYRRRGLGCGLTPRASTAMVRAVPPSRFRIAVVQMRCASDPDANVATAIARIRDAAREGASIACLPEPFRTPYFCQREDPAHFDLAEPIPGPTTTQLAAVAREAKIAVVASLFERRAPGVYHNTAIVLDADGSLVGRYRKM